MSTSRTGPLTRRTLLGTALAASGLAGCTTGGDSSDRRPTAGRSTAGGGMSPDVAVATDALAAVRRVQSGVAHTTHRFPALRGQLSGFAELHRAHARVLADAVPAGSRSGQHGPPYQVPRNPAKALHHLRAAEQDLHDRLGELAQQARSGDFARLLAAMGAALTQRLEATS